jgi:caffeoyl-CoA O-methyltransferase
MSRLLWIVAACVVSLMVVDGALAQPPGGPPRGRFGGPKGRPGMAVENDLQKETLAADEAEKRILGTLEQMWQGERYRNVSPDDGRLMRLLAEAVDAKLVVEIGTSTGESALWLALALQSTDGHLYTHELDEGRAKVAQENFKKAGVDDRITLILGDAHETAKNYLKADSPMFVDTANGKYIDILFLDADKEGYIDYMQKLMPLVRPGGLLIAHNMNRRQVDERFLKEITEDPQLETMILLKEGTGVGVTLKKR